jgi:hypothetical protein
VLLILFETLLIMNQASAKEIAQNHELEQQQIKDLEIKF